MIRSGLRLARGTLCASIAHRTREAVASGALYPIDTRQEFIEQASVRFLVRIVSSLMRKDDAIRMQQSSQPADPFLPYERALFVANISDTHVAVLNKYNVIDKHLLIVTRTFEHQETLLTPDDLFALWTCMQEFEALGFYNGGMIAGASQPHKHLQLVPLPLADSGPPIPIASLFTAARVPGTQATLAALPFRHTFTWLDPSLVREPWHATRETYAYYRAMLATVGVHVVDSASEQRQSAPYNLLLTRQWMLLVPRSTEFFHSISINALGFAGALLVRNEQQLALLKGHGPMTALAQVGLPAP
jgi:ATP adenylyltransferase